MVVGLFVGHIVTASVARPFPPHSNPIVRTLSCSRRQQDLTANIQSRRPSRSCIIQARSSVVMAAQGGGDGKTRVLFVCLGNICRSPTAEAVFNKVVQDAGLADKFEIDSCGTGGGSSNWYLPGGFSYHEGDPADPRMTKAAAQRGVRLTSRSRPLTPEDLSRFDYILGMDASNLAAIRRAAAHWAEAHPVPKDYAEKVLLMSDFLRSERFKRYSEVPDPYYGGSSGFDLVLDLLDDACINLLEHIQEQQQAKQ